MTQIKVELNYQVLRLTHMPRPVQKPHVDSCWKPMSRLVLVLGYMAYAAMAATPKPLAEQKKAVVQVIAIFEPNDQSDRKQIVSTGTGFIITPGDLVVTASHVVAHREPSLATDVSSDTVYKFSDGVTTRYSSKIRIKLSDGREVSATPQTKLGVLQAHLLRDYCVLKLSTKVNVPTLDLGSWSELQDGDDLTAWGFPLGLPGPVLIKATVALKVEQPVTIEAGKAPESVNSVIFQGPNNKGMSGGPVIHSNTGKVVGVVSTRLIGIGQELERVRQHVVMTRKEGGVFLGGVNPNETSIEIINVLDNYLMSGMGSAVSTDPIKADLVSPVKRQTVSPPK
jgi:Trypsin-like peptidase domain